MHPTDLVEPPTPRNLESIARMHIDQIATVFDLPPEEINTTHNRVKDPVEALRTFYAEQTRQIREELIDSAHRRTLDNEKK